MIDDDAWVDHASVVAHFCGGQSDLCAWPWPLPQPIPWNKLSVANTSCSVDFACALDLTAEYRSFWQQTETHAAEASKVAGLDLPRSMFGRAQKLEPVKRVPCHPPISLGRPGDPQPAFLENSWVHFHMFRQVRRLHSLVRILAAQPFTERHAEHSVQLWSAIMRAPGFKPSFAAWWRHRDLAVGEPWVLPHDPPSLNVASIIASAVAWETKRVEVWLGRQQRYVAKKKARNDVNQLFRCVKRDAPAPVDVLFEPSTAVVESVDEAECALVLDRSLPYSEGDILVVAGTVVDPVACSADKVWLHDGGVVESDPVGATVVSRKPIGKLDDVFRAFVEQWQSRWGRHSGVPLSQWTQIVNFARSKLQPVDPDTQPLTETLFRATVASKKKAAAVGLDGVSKSDLVHLSSAKVASLLQLYHRAEATGLWPHQASIGAVKSLAKNEHPDGVADYRPITVFSLVYRVYSSFRSRFWISQLERALDPALFGNRSARSACHMWRLILDKVESAYQDDSPACGLILDLEKAFNTLPRLPVFAIAQVMGLSFDLLTAWAGFLGSMTRRFVVRGSYSPPVSSTCGFPEGCGLSCVAMLLLDQVWHLWVQQLVPNVQALSFVDNWEVVASSAACLTRAYHATLEFARLLDLTVDRRKSCTWSTSKDCREDLRSRGFTVVWDGRDLGAHLTYTRQLRNKTVTSRIASLSDFWTKMRASCCPHRLKVRVILAAAWPRAFYGIAASVLGKQHFVDLRTCALKALGLSKPGANPSVQLLLDAPGADPQEFAILATFRHFRELGVSPAQLAMLTSCITEGPAAPGSVSAVLVERVHQLGWALGSDGCVRDHVGSFNLATGNWAEIALRVSMSWQKVVAQMVSHRQSFAEFVSVDVPATRRLLESLPAVDQGTLRRCLNGSQFTNCTACHWSDDGSALCVECGAVDTAFHRYWTCPSTDDLRANLDASLLALVPSLPLVLTQHGWTLQSPFVHAWLQYLSAIPIHFPVPVNVVPRHCSVDLFTDGSCLWPTEPAYRLAAWAVVVACPFDSSRPLQPANVVATDVLPGIIQSAFRAELWALCAALHYSQNVVGQIRIWCDCQAVVSKFHAFVLGRVPVRPNTAHQDLWEQVVQLVDTIGRDRVFVGKVRAHQDCGQIADHLEAWYALNNACADRAAVTSNSNRASSVWQLWEQHSAMVARHSTLGAAIAKHMVAVNRRWFGRHSDARIPEAKPARIGKVVPVHWDACGPAEMVGKRFAKEFGVALAGVVHEWWSGLMTWQQSDVAWVSYLQLFIDFQLVMKHRGVLKLHGKWIDIESSPASFCEHWSVRARVKWFRLMIQAYGRGVGQSFGRATTRPTTTQWLTCFVGCASLPVRPLRLQKVDEYLAQHLVAPISGQGEAMDRLKLPVISPNTGD